MGGGYLEEEEWERIFRQRQVMQGLMLSEVTARELVRQRDAQPEVSGNRQQRRAAARKARP